MQAKMQYQQVELPGGLLSSLKWDFFGGKERSIRGLKIFQAIPDLVFLTGAYFDVISKEGAYNSERRENFGKLCGTGRIY